MSARDYIPTAILRDYEVHDFHHAAAILAKEFPNEFRELCDFLGEFRIPRTSITKGGGSESEIPKMVKAMLLPMGWKPTNFEAKVMVGESTLFQSTHEIDFVKGRVAFDLEWNSKDQTFDRDLFAFSKFFEYDQISVGVLLTRSEELNEEFRALGVLKKYGASTTWMGKLLQ